MFAAKGRILMLKIAIVLDPMKGKIEPRGLEESFSHPHSWDLVVILM